MPSAISRARMPLRSPPARRLAAACCWLAAALFAVQACGQGYPTRSAQPYARADQSTESADDYNRYPPSAPATQPWPEEAPRRYAPAAGDRTAQDPQQQQPQQQQSASPSNRPLALRFESATNPAPVRGAGSDPPLDARPFDERALDKPAVEARSFEGVPASFSQPADPPAAGQPAMLLPPAERADHGAHGEKQPYPLPSMATLLGSLGVVLGLFLLLAWLLKLAMPKGAALLPREAVEMLGRTQLAGRHYVHLIRCGNKVLLVSVTQGAAETLTEITDPAEVDRLAGICYQSRPFSASTNFRQLLTNMGSERPAGRRRTRLEDELDLSRLTGNDTYALGQGATHG